MALQPNPAWLDPRNDPALVNITDPVLLLQRIRNGLYQEMNICCDAKKNLTNADCLDHIRDLCKKYHLEFRAIRDPQQSLLHLFAFDPKLERLNPNVNNPALNPQYLGAVRRIQGADNVKGSKVR